MSGVLGRHSLLFGMLACAVQFAAAPALGETVDLRLDQAKLLKLPDRVSTIVIGNPLIADATLQRGGLLVVTGKGYGATNLLALDRQGQVLMSRTVQVLGPSTADLIVVYKGIQRESYSCAPECQPRNTLGDGNDFFGATLGQMGARNGAAQSTAAPAPAAAPAR
ncbi:MAG TPA: pilus assembly protein N-terminal domain-containing protein [Pseudolabrys sp.]|jgi:hypothetical protein|nr:pilus assembly protein N-terminal domain-containing protein [Pseudolabrys sp.]